MFAEVVAASIQPSHAGNPTPGCGHRGFALRGRSLPLGIMVLARTRYDPGKPGTVCPSFGTGTARPGDLFLRPSPWAQRRRRRAWVGAAVAFGADRRPEPAAPASPGSPSADGCAAI